MLRWEGQEAATDGGAGSLRQESDKAALYGVRGFTLMGFPSSACGGRGWCGGERVSLSRILDGDPSTCVPLNNGTSLPRQTTFPPGAFWDVELLTLVSLSCLHAANSSLLPRSALLTPPFSTQPLPALADSRLKLGLPGYDQSPSISVYFAARKGTSPGAMTSPLLQLPSPKGCGPHPVPFFLFLPFFSFILPGHAGIFSCPFRCLGSFARDQQVLCVNFSTCRCTPDILVGRGEPQVLLFHHLDLDLNLSFQ